MAEILVGEADRILAKINKKARSLDGFSEKQAFVYSCKL
jgi:hypothetical protein